ncbi:acyltransferase family protein [Elizabethkingia meningoseptica]|uniref:acyltransferase family protein n=1 Tax=Elizabethkingia meningoseptica TaxID=238 RepID=UPI002013774C|nr:acyltransferase [Elizabethkingia meningoseptica]MCL1675689.1 acyltransferase [Elizabethkingia meningoseptica]MCL1686895.1 acyltransferase [Elizabethkingia meningoseptica]
MEKFFKNKIDALQVIRGYAAILVALCHIWNDGWIPKILVVLGEFGVDIFFVLSGFIMCLTVKLNTGSNIGNALYFMKKRISRIYPVYIICAIPLLLFVTKAEGIKDVYFYIGNLLLLPTFTGDPNYRLVLGPGWSLTYEMFFYVIFSVVLLFSSARKNVLYTIFFILTGIVLLVNLLGMQGPQLGWVNFSYIIGDFRLLNFASGIICYYLYIYFKERINLHINVSIILLLLISLIAAVLIDIQIPHFVSRGLPAMAIIIIFSLTGNASLTKPVMQKLVFLGDASYSIYLIHFYFTFLKFKALKMAGNHFFSGEILLNTVDFTMFISSVIAGCMLYVFIEKPIVNFVSKKVKA